MILPFYFQHSSLKPSKSTVFIVFSPVIGRVHVGFVLLLKGDSPNISVKSELKSGKLVTLDECKAVKKRMETWNQIVLTYIAQDRV